MIIVPISELANHAALERRCLEAGGPVFVKKGDNLRLVVMDMDYFEKFIRERDLISLINEGLKTHNGPIRQWRRGQTKDRKAVGDKRKRFDRIGPNPSLI